MKRVTRREVLQTGAKAAVTAMMAPLIAEAGATAEDTRMEKTMRTAPASGEELCFMEASVLSGLLRTKKVSAVEVMKAHLAQIERVNPKVNAIVTLVEKGKLLAQAGAADEALEKGNWMGPLHGMPLAVKDLKLTKGIRTTFGSPLFKDNIPNEDCLVVEREKRAGGIVLGKTNVPEFGLGSQTFNKVFGATRNPYDLSKTCGGSTGGGAVTVACGMAPLADGSDYGGSLRNPPNFCGVVGLRTSPGRVPNPPGTMVWQPFSVFGPVARNVKDCAFFLSVLAGPDARVPISIEQPGSMFAAPLEGRSFKSVRVAMFQDMGLPWEPEVKEAIRAQGKVFESLGCIMEEAEPDFSDANECFLAWRHWLIEAEFGDMIATKGDQLNEYVHWHVEEGRKLTGPYLSRVEKKRSAFYEQVHKFMGKYEFFVLPVNQVLPFDVNQHYPTEIHGVNMESYLAWMKSAYYITVTGHPAISVPCAFSRSGLPIGIQIVGRHHDDWGVLQMAYAFEEARNLQKPRAAALG